MQENHLERSSSFFSLAEEHGIPTTPGAQKPLEDITFLDFKDKYRQWAQQRDEALLRYITSKPSIFRIYLPYNCPFAEKSSQIANCLVNSGDEP